MPWLANTLIEARYERETPDNERQRRMVGYLQRARVARAEAFAGFGRGIKSAVFGLATLGRKYLGRKYRRRQERQAAIRELSALDDHILSDIGVSRGNRPRRRRIGPTASGRRARQGGPVRFGGKRRCE